MAEAAVWIVQLHGELRVALSEREMIHIVEHPICEHISYTLAYCHEVLLWEGDMLPGLDLSAWLTGQPAARQAHLVWYCVLAGTVRCATPIRCTALYDHPPKGVGQRCAGV